MSKRRFDTSLLKGLDGRLRSDVQRRTAATVLGLSERQVQRLMGVSLVRTGGPQNAQVTVESLLWVLYCRTQPKAKVDCLNAQVAAALTIGIYKYLDALSDEELAGLFTSKSGA